LGHGTYRDEYLGVKIPPTNLRDYHLSRPRASPNSSRRHALPTGAAKDIMSDTQFDVVIAAYLIPDPAKK
jgi:hypothetical protein